MSSSGDFINATPAGENSDNERNSRLQGRLILGENNDRFEQEAERVSQQITSAPECPAISRATPKIQRYTPGSAKNAISATTNSAVNDTLGNPGRPLEPALQADMGQRFQHDFSRVRVHAGPDAQQSAREINANAYTVGNNIVFGEGRYAPSTHEGRKLIAHELTHVVQQSMGGAAAGVIARSPSEETWVQDQEGALYYNTQAEAERRLKALQSQGAWQQLRVTSFKHKGKTLWRVEMRGKKTDTGAKPDDSADAPKAPAKKETPPADANADKGNAGNSKTATTAGTGTPAAAGVKRVFSLTFDDGPHAAALGAGTNLTENVLDTLKAKSIQAGFFIQTGVSFRGANAVGRKLVARMQAEGHTVGVHTGGSKDHESHPSAQKDGRLEAELKAGQSYITKQTGSAPNFVRPPFGKSNSAVNAVYKKVGLTNLLWDIDGDKGASSLAQLKSRLDSSDPKDPGIPAVQARGWSGTTAIQPKIVVLYHDIRANTAGNIGDVIDHIRAETKLASSGKDSADFAPP